MLSSVTRYVYVYHVTDRTMTFKFDFDLDDELVVQDAAPEVEKKPAPNATAEAEPFLEIPLAELVRVYFQKKSALLTIKGFS
jgi:hypothetical protein